MTKRQHIGYVGLVVRDYDEAIEFYSQKLNFVLVEDTPLDIDKRWVLMAPPGSSETCLLLAKAAAPEQTSRIGNQTGSRLLFLHTDNFWRDYDEYCARGVTFRRPPKEETSWYSSGI